jgi:superfamily II helicase
MKLLKLDRYNDYPLLCIKCDHYVEEAYKLRIYNKIKYICKQCAENIIRHELERLI